LNKEEFLKKLGRNIVKIRSEKGISQAEFARLCFKDPQNIERIENGKVNTSVYNLFVIAKILNCSPKDFFPESGL
jgi:transcriptional regulator with XRE-family HTH domain